MTGKLIPGEPARKTRPQTRTVYLGDEDNPNRVAISIPVGTIEWLKRDPGPVQFEEDTP